MLKLEGIKAIVVHHSQSRGGDVDFIQYIHVDENGWSDVGYHYVIGNGKSHGQWAAARDGEIQIGRTTNWQGAQVRGFNKHAIGICLIGNFMVGYPTIKQQEALVRLLAELCFMYKLESKDIFGHKDVGNSDCPGRFLYQLLPDIRHKVDKKLEELPFLGKPE